MSNSFDLVVIGAGTGGYSGAIRAARHGLRVALVECSDLGGTCLNRGCIPTKALLHSAQLYKSRDTWQKYGVSASDVRLDEQAAYAHKDSIVRNLRSGIESLVNANRISLFRQRAVIEGAHSVRCGEELLNAKHILIATGSIPASREHRNIKGIEYALNSDDVLNAPIDARDIAIIGAGAVGVEFATYFNAVGRNVTILCPEMHIVQAMSKDVGIQLASVFRRNGIKVITGACVNQITEDGTIHYSQSQAEYELRADAVVQAVGRVPNIKGLGLECLGLGSKGYVEVDANMHTGVEGVYACGDVTGGIQLAHYAAASAICAVESMLGLPHSIDLSTVPSCIYTTPEIALVGKKESEVDGARVGKFLMGANGKSIIEGEPRGFVRVVADQGGKVVGAELFCARATDIIGELSLAVSKGIDAHELGSVIHPHPTVMEAVGEAIEDIFGMAIHMLPRRLK